MSFFENYDSKADLIKGFEMYHDNDVLLLYPGMNQDRELTGAFKFTAVTDYFKLRWFNPFSYLKVKDYDDGNIPDLSNPVPLLETATPRILGTATTLNWQTRCMRTNRPFASFMCFERAKHRTWRHGMIRHTGEFQIGALGISQGRKIQAKIHEDIVTESQFVHGWDKQIANGGRLALQANHKLHILLYFQYQQVQIHFQTPSLRGAAYPQIFWKKSPCRNGPEGWNDHDLYGSRTALFESRPFEAIRQPHDCQQAKFDRRVLDLSLTLG